MKISGLLGVTHPRIETQGCIYERQLGRRRCQAHIKQSFGEADHLTDDVRSFNHVDPIGRRDVGRAIKEPPCHPCRSKLLQHLNKTNSQEKVTKGTAFVSGLSPSTRI